MKWLVYGAGVLVSAALLTALRWSGLYPATSPAGAAIVTMLVFFFGVYFFPRLIIRRIGIKRAAAPVQDAAPAPVSEDIPFVPPVDNAPVEERGIEPKRKPVRRDVVGYQFAVAILLFFSVFFAIKYAGASSHVDDLSAASEERYLDGYNDGYQDAGDTSYENGYEAGRQDGVAEGYNLMYDEANYFHTKACVVTTEGNRYHYFDCPHIQDREYWIYNIELAELKGYTPCLDCWDGTSLLRLFP